MRICNFSRFGASRRLRIEKRKRCAVRALLVADFARYVKSDIVVADPCVCRNSFLRTCCRRFNCNGIKVFRVIAVQGRQRDLLHFYRIRTSRCNARARRFPLLCSGSRLDRPFRCPNMRMRRRHRYRNGDRLRAFRREREHIHARIRNGERLTRHGLQRARAFAAFRICDGDLRVFGRRPGQRDLPARRDLVSIGACRNDGHHGRLRLRDLER